MRSHWDKSEHFLDKTKFEWWKRLPLPTSKMKCTWGNSCKTSWGINKVINFPREQVIQIWTHTYLNPGWFFKWKSRTRDNSIAVDNSNAYRSIPNRIGYVVGYSRAPVQLNTILCSNLGIIHANYRFDKCTCPLLSEVELTTGILFLNRIKCSWWFDGHAWPILPTYREFRVK